MNSFAGPSPHRTPLAFGARESCSILEIMDPTSSQKSPLAVRLIVGAGRNAGVTAEIREGIYMIGRDRECQIRPKSQSVSERHCLVHHQGGTVRLFDLESERGTFVNDKRVPPKTWRLLNHGDQLRCGRYWFEVAIYLRGEEAESPSDDTAEDLLGVEMAVADVADVELFDDDNFVSEDAVVASRVAGEPVQPATLATEPGAAPGNPTTPKPIRLPKPRIAKYHSTRSRRIPQFSSPDSWKTLGIGLALMLLCGYLGWTIYEIQKGAPVKIVQGVD